MPHSAEYRRILHRMGYYNYQNGLIYRHLNQDGGWDDHLKHCREYILNTVDRIRPEKVTILGSGWLLDLPLAELIERSCRIVLVDIIHPPEVLIQAGSLKNIEIKEDDITGGLISEVWEETCRYSCLRKMKDLSGIKVPLYKPDYKSGLIISLNILTQLENLLIAFIKKKSDVGEEMFSVFREEVQKKHIEFLTSFNSVLITDVEEVIKTRDGKTVCTPTLKTEIPLGSSRDEWLWDFDLAGSDYYNSTSFMKVIAVTFENEKGRSAE